MADQTFYRHEIIAMSPRNFDEAKLAAEEIKDGNPTIVNFSQLNPEERMWAIHYLNGVIFALDGTVKDIGNQVFLFAPCNVTVDLEG
ncbi:MAG: cell division protein SepF [bacterium]